MSHPAPLKRLSVIKSGPTLEDLVACLTDEKRFVEFVVLDKDGSERKFQIGVALISRAPHTTSASHVRDRSLDEWVNSKRPVGKLLCFEGLGTGCYINGVYAPDNPLEKGALWTHID